MTQKQLFFVYRDELFAGSETFIPGQAEVLTRFEPFYVGLRRRSGLSMPDSRVHIISRGGYTGKVQRARFKLLGPGRRLQMTLAARHPVLIHAHFGPDGCHAMPLARALNVPLVVSFHGYDVSVTDNLMPRLYVKQRNLMAQQATKFVCISEFIRRQAIAKGFPPDKMSVHYTGIDINFFTPRPVPRLSSVLFVGRLVPKKGCEYLIHAMAVIQKVMPTVELVVIGDGPLRQELEQKAASNLKTFRFLGAQGPMVVRDWMNRAMVFSAPSVVAPSGDAEGFGMIFAEAQAMGLPVVSFASGGIPEAVAHEQTGFLVPERDAEALSTKLLLLLQNKELRYTFAEAGQSRVRLLFDSRKQADTLEAIYEDTLLQWNSVPASTNHVFEHKRHRSEPANQLDEHNSAEVLRSLESVNLATASEK